MLLRTLAWVLMTVHTVKCLILHRDVNSITGSLGTISGGLVSMNATLNQFEGGFNGTLLALQIQGEASTLLDDIENATTAAGQSSNLDEADSATVAFAIVALSSNIYEVLANLVDKKGAFDAAILGIGSASALVEYDLKSLKNSTDTLSQALSSKLSTTIQEVAPLVVSDIDFHFDQAIAAYGS